MPHHPIITDAAPLPRGRADRPLVIELAGLAGAGKSAITRALGRLDPTIHARPRVSLRWHLVSLPALLPTFVGLHWPFRGVLSKEMKRILRLRALHRLVHRTRGGGALVFDEGPVYMLARILFFGGRNIETEAFARWWRRAIARWTATLDVIVWLHAPDDVLAARIHTRQQRHRYQGADDQALTAFLNGYRAAFARVLTELTVAGGPQLWTLATDRGSADVQARELLDRLRTPGATARQPRQIAV